MPDIFISYSRGDEPVARRFADRFIEAGLDVWWDSHLRSGEDWDRLIEQSLREARAVVVLWSPGAVESRWVRAEATVALRLGTLVPAMISPCDLPIVFEMTQTADLAHWDGSGDDPAWKSFLSDVSAKAGHEPGERARKSLAGNDAAALPPGGERRRVTVLACNLEIDPEAAEDPEDRIEIVSAAHSALEKAVAPFDGLRLDGHGESFTMLFGMQRTREDDAIRAVDAALAGKDAVVRLARREGTDIDLRCGLRTGTVVIEQSSAKPLGGAIDEARRLEMRAGPGEVLVCPVTASLVEGYFPIAQSGAGAARVEGPHSAETRFELSRTRGLTGFVGRGEELALMRAARDLAAQGQGRVVGLVAEAGSGKSRLSHEFKEECRAAGMPVVEGAAKANAGNVPLIAVLELFRSFFGLSGQEPRSEARDRIHGWIRENEPKLESALPLLFEFLSLAPDDAVPTGLDPQLRQRQLVGLFRHLLTLAGKDKPALVLVEDLHWLDEASGQFLEQVVEGQSRSPSLLLLNYRPEFRADWMQGSVCQQLSLQPLGQDDVDALLENLIGNDPSVMSLREPIRERTRGNPFFIEEIVRALAETGQLTGGKGAYRFTGDAGTLAVPDTVTAVLAARIDRLDPRDKGVLQAASVVGKDFDEPVLAEICELSPGELGDALTALQRTEFIEETEIFPVNRFTFRHPLTQETARSSLLKKTRKDLHAKIAQVLEAADPAQLDEQSALIAGHWEEAGEKAKAATWYARSADWISANNQSAALYNWAKVRDLVGPEPEGEGEVGLALGAVMQMLNLNFRVEVDLELAKQLRAEGEALADAIGNDALKLQQSILFSRIQCGAGDLPAYLASARSNLAAAEAAGDPGLILIARVMLIDACNYVCLYEDQIKYAAEWTPQYPRDLPREQWPTGFNPYTFWGFMRGGALGWTARYDEMLEQFDETLKLAEEDGTPEVTGWVMFSKSIFAAGEGDHETARDSLFALRELTDNGGGPLNMAHRHLADSTFASFEERYDDAVEAAKAAERFFSRLEKQWEGFAMMLHARALLGKEDWDAAYDKANEAIATSERCTVKPMAASALAIRASAALRRDGVVALDKAREDVARAANLLEESGAMTLRGHIERAKADLAAFEETATA